MLLVPPGGQNWNQLECWIFLFTEFACFAAGEIIQVIEAMPGSVVPLAMFNNTFLIIHFEKYILRNSFLEILFKKSILKNTLWEKHFEKLVLRTTFWEKHFDNKTFVRNTFLKIDFEKYILTKKYISRNLFRKLFWQFFSNFLTNF